jgi:putative two-component system response regulator
VDYIQKPLIPEIAKARIRNHLELKLLRDSLETEVETRTGELVVAEEATILGMALLAEYRDTDAGYHLKRTKMYVRILAEQHVAMRPGVLDASDIKEIVASSVLHDIGKVAIPDAILFKPGPLDYDEMHQMKKHPEFGAAVIDRMEAQLGPTPFLKYAREITSCHHEKWDGSGYPLGLSGDSVPLSAAIMAVADVYDALRSLRPYKKPISHEETCRIILDGDGRTRSEHFNPRVLEAFRAVSGQFRVISEEFGDR